MNAAETAYRHALDVRQVPEHMRDGLVMYLVHKIPPGHFMTAVLENDLKAAFARADDTCRDAMPAIVGFLYNVAPSNAWGSVEAVQEWLS